MKKHAPSIALAVAVIATFIVVGYSWTYRLNHPDMTDTRVFLNTWKVTVPLGVLALGAICYVRIMENRDLD